jgi:hypothetical protein
MFTTTVKKNKKQENSYEIKFQGMTEGKIIALLYALKEYGKTSSVGNDVSLSLRYGLERCEDTNKILENISRRNLTPTE